MVEFICTSSDVAKILQESVQWHLLMKHLERKGIVASLWIEGEETPEVVQMPQLEKITTQFKTCNGDQLTSQHAVTTTSTSHHRSRDV